MNFVRVPNRRDARRIYPEVAVSSVRWSGCSYCNSTYQARFIDPTSDAFARLSVRYLHIVRPALLSSSLLFSIDS